MGKIWKAEQVHFFYPSELYEELGNPNSIDT